MTSLGIIAGAATSGTMKAKCKPFIAPRLLAAIKIGYAFNVQKLRCDATRRKVAAKNKPLVD